MALRKCPRCELNYILDEGELCTVCREEVHGKRDREETTLLCSVCGEATVVPGQEMCRGCIAELRSIEMGAIGAEDEGEERDTAADLTPEPVSSLDEINAIAGEDDAPEGVGEDDEDLDEEDEDEDELAQAK